MRTMSLFLCFIPLFVSSQTLWNRIYHRPVLLGFSGDPSPLSYLGDICPTLDGGYVVTFSNAVPNWDVGGPTQSYAIKLDSTFKPLWSKVLKGDNNTCIALPDSSVLFMGGKDAKIYLTCDDYAGQTIYDKKIERNFLSPYWLGASIMPIDKGNGNIKAFGNMSNAGLFTTTTTCSFLMDLDSVGNLTHFDTLPYYMTPFNTTNYGFPTFFTGDGNGHYYVGIKDQDNNQICMKIDANNSVLWQYTLLDTATSLQVTYAKALANGDVLIGGKRSYAPFLIRLSANGTLLWAKNYVNSVSEGIMGKITETPQGEILAVVAYVVYTSSASYSYPLLVKFDANGNVLSNKTFFRSISLPYQKSPNDWYYFTYNPFVSFPSLFNSDSLGNTFCNDSSVYIAPSINFTVFTQPSYWGFYPVSGTSFIPTIDSATITISWQDTCIYNKYSTEILPANTLIQAYTIFPNPCDNDITFAFDENIQGKVEIEIYSLIGQMQYKSQISPSQSPNLILPTHSFPIGTYFCKVSYQGNTSVKKFCVIR